AVEAAAGAELSRGVATLRDPNARADPAAAQLAAWSLVHGFSTLWLSEAVNADVKKTDPMNTVARIATMLFEG
ncbi:MAG TPA: TetR family transcriptional regulator, partial [Mycobacterium sp.]|nr:TetR family transcriptional regulator [Mycobacterium sp.]